MKKDRIILAISGASGVIYAKRLFDFLIDNHREVHLIISKQGFLILRDELNLSTDYFGKKGVCLYDNNNLYASVASGSFKTRGMVIVPSSMGTMGRIAAGLSLDLIGRVADVNLKEKRRLILVPREIPYNLIHLENMVKLVQAGATIIPASPAFYFNPKTIDDLVDFLVGRILDHLDIPHNLVREWES